MVEGQPRRSRPVSAAGTAVMEADGLTDRRRSAAGGGWALSYRTDGDDYDDDSAAAPAPRVWYVPACAHSWRQRRWVCRLTVRSAGTFVVTRSSVALPRDDARRRCGGARKERYGSIAQGQDITHSLLQPAGAPISLLKAG